MRVLRPSSLFPFFRSVSYVPVCTQVTYLPGGWRRAWSGRRQHIHPWNGGRPEFRPRVALSTEVPNVGITSTSSIYY